MSLELTQAIEDLRTAGGKDIHVFLLQEMVDSLKPGDVGDDTWLSFSILEQLVGKRGDDAVVVLLILCCTDLVHLLQPKYIAVVKREWGEETITLSRASHGSDKVEDHFTGEVLGEFRHVARLGFIPTKRLRELVESK